MNPAGETIYSFTAAAPDVGPTSSWPRPFRSRKPFAASAARFSRTGPRGPRPVSRNASTPPECQGLSLLCSVVRACVRARVVCGGMKKKKK